LQDRRVEAFGEPTVDGREEITGFDALAGLIFTSGLMRHNSERIQQATPRL
jgi:hypothetical protein